MSGVFRIQKTSRTPAGWISPPWATLSRTGAACPPTKILSLLFRDRYPATLNLGGGGNGPLLMLATLKEYAEPVKARTVLWFYFEDNDLTDLRKEKNAPLLMRYLTDGFRQGLFGQQAAIDRSLAAYMEKAEIEAAGKEKDSFDPKRIEANISWTNWLNATIKVSRLRSRIGLV
jgi:hypothetical protein